MVRPNLYLSKIEMPYLLFAEVAMVGNHVFVSPMPVILP
jgi:hypothetical protein